MSIACRRRRVCTTQEISFRLLDDDISRSQGAERERTDSLASVFSLKNLGAFLTCPPLTSLVSYFLAINIQKSRGTLL